MTEQLKKIDWASIGIQLIIIIFFAGLAYGKLDTLDKKVNAKVEKEVFDEVVKRIDGNLIEIKAILKERNKNE